MNEYVMCFAMPVSQENMDEFIAMNQASAKVALANGATSYVVCRGDGLKPGKVTSFPRSVQQKEDEEVMIGWMTFANQKDAARCNAASMQDPELSKFMQPGKMPFDGMRALNGAFIPIIEEKL